MAHVLNLFVFFEREEYHRYNELVFKITTQKRG